MDIRGTISPKFARRLREACDNHPDCPPLHQGRLTWLKGRLAAQGLKVSVESVRKWLDGGGRPKQEKCEALAQVLGVDATWLYMGTGEAKDGEGPVSANLTRAPTIPIAVRDGVVVEISGLPLDLSRREANKIANVILAHAEAES